MKTKIALLSFILILCSFSVSAYSPSVTFNDGRTLYFNPDVWCSVNDRFMDFNSNGVQFLCYTETLPEGLVNYIPVRTISEALNLEISYNELSQAVELRGNENIMRFYNNSTDIDYFDANYNSLGASSFATSAGTPCPVRVIENTTYVPIRAVTENFGYVIDFKDNQIIIADSSENLIPKSKSELAVTVSIYGIYPDVSIAKDTISPGFNTFLKNNELDNLTGSICRNDSGWIIGTANTVLHDYNMIIPASYSNTVYFKPSANASWTKLNDAESTDKIYAVSFNISEAISESVSFIFETPSEINDSTYRKVFVCLSSQITLPKKMTVQKYSAAYNPIVTDKPSNAELYHIQNSDTQKNYFVLIYDNQSEFLNDSIFTGVTFNETVTLSLPNLSSLTVYSEIIIVDITDDI